MTNTDKLPIPTYALVDEPCGDEWRTELLEQAGGDLCKADDVRGLVERMEKAEAQRDCLAQHIEWANREYVGDHEAVDAEIASSGECVPDIVYSMAKLRHVLKMSLETSRRRGSRLKDAEAQRDRLAELLRSALDAEDEEALEFYDGVVEPHLHVCRDRVTKAIADIEKEIP